eukprot:TRINITY_DN42290_c0_g1_i1.p2 TRINITY_DN42290_c0_g1~~TRINITY_DN42290_c0_g1_i1.p2  ORF type:complete len:157 (+),score=17.39 TRINITY_DN42290_c0_g1_i1:583-1053(+)
MLRPPTSHSGQASLPSSARGAPSHIGFLAVDLVDKMGLLRVAGQAPSQLQVEEPKNVVIKLGEAGGGGAKKNQSNSRRPASQDFTSPSKPMLPTKARLLDLEESADTGTCHEQDKSLGRAGKLLQMPLPAEGFNQVEQTGTSLLHSFAIQAQDHTR